MDFLLLWYNTLDMAQPKSGQDAGSRAQSGKPSLRLQQKVQNWQLLQGRLTAAKWISMTEPEVIREITDLEAEPLFRKMMFDSQGYRPILRRRRWPASSLHPGFYELKEEIAPGGESGDVQGLLDRHKKLVRLIRRIGVQDFERYFLYGEDGKSLPEICEAVGIALEDGQRILDLVLEVGAHAEFFRPAKLPEGAGIFYHCVAAIEQDTREDENLYFRFLSPHWARGRYMIDYEKLEEWKAGARLEPKQNRRLRQLLKRIELINMRQDILFQILSRITTEQSSFLRSRLGYRRRPLSLRELARRIGVAPSTVSRAVGNRSVKMPWGEELPLKRLLTSQRIVIMSLLSEWNDRDELGAGVTDEKLMQRLAGEAGITVSRRTVNECRRRLLGGSGGSKRRRRQ